MEDEKAVVILKSLLTKNFLTAEEKEAVMAAVGLLGWAEQSRRRYKAVIRAKKEERGQSLKW
jgi:hypothetical protein